jgi:hypothetical protein
MSWRMTTAEKTFAGHLRPVQPAKDGAIAETRMAIETPMTVR